MDKEKIKQLLAQASDAIKQIETLLADSTAQQEAKAVTSEPTPACDLASLRDMCIAAAKQGMTTNVVEFLTAHGAKKLTELDEQYYAELVQELKSWGLKYE